MLLSRRVAQGCISFEWDPAKMGGGGSSKGKGKKARSGEKVVLAVSMLSRLSLRVFVDKSSQVPAGGAFVARHVSLTL